MAKRTDTEGASRRPDSRVASFSATEAQNNFGRVVDQAIREGVVAITRYDRPAVFVVSAERFEAMATTAQPDLDALTREFDAMVEAMQTPSAIEAGRSLFDAAPAELGAAAVRAARRKRK